MDEDKRNELRAGLDEAIESGSIIDASPDQLQRWLISLTTGRIPNQTVHPREILRGITINHIQMARTIRQLEKTIERLDAGNIRTQRLVIILAVIAIIIGIVQAVASIIPLFRK